jgi:small neutral amino acid transporter SnatA (MarC family)
MDENIIGLIVGFGGGAFCIIASILNWNWFFNHRRAYIFVKLFGRTGARVVYSILGIFLFFLGFKILNVF